MSLFEYINNDQELIEQLSQLGIKPHYFTEEQQQEKYRRWEKELAIPWRKRKLLQQQK